MMMMMLRMMMRMRMRMRMRMMMRMMMMMLRMMMMMVGSGWVQPTSSDVQSLSPGHSCLATRIFGIPSWRN